MSIVGYISRGNTFRCSWHGGRLHSGYANGIKVSLTCVGVVTTGSVGLCILKNFVNDTFASPNF